MASGYICPECGLDYDTVSPSDAVVAARSFPRRFRDAVAGAPEETLRRRPDDTTWSAVEYCAHVGDVLDWMADTVRAMTMGDSPDLDFPDPDQLAVDRKYNEQALDGVLDHVASASERFGAAVEAVAPEDWTRTASFPWGERDALTMARNGVHEGVHHLRDVERVLEAVSST